MLTFYRLFRIEYWSTVLIHSIWYLMVFEIIFYERYRSIRRKAEMAVVEVYWMRHFYGFFSSENRIDETVKIKFSV